MRSTNNIKYPERKWVLNIQKKEYGSDEWMVALYFKMI